MGDWRSSDEERREVALEGLVQCRVKAPEGLPGAEPEGELRLEFELDRLAGWSPRTAKLLERCGESVLERGGSCGDAGLGLPPCEPVARPVSTLRFGFCRRRTRCTEDEGDCWVFPGRQSGSRSGKEGFSAGLDGCAGLLSVRGDSSGSRVTGFPLGLDARSLRFAVGEVGRLPECLFLGEAGRWGLGSDWRWAPEAELLAAGGPRFGVPGWGSGKEGLRMGLCGRAGRRRAFCWLRDPEGSLLARREGLVDRLSADPLGPASGAASPGGCGPASREGRPTAAVSPARPWGPGGPWGPAWGLGQLSLVELPDRLSLMLTMPSPTSVAARTAPASGTVSFGRLPWPPGWSEGSDSEGRFGDASGTTDPGPSSAPRAPAVSVSDRDRDRGRDWRTTGLKADGSEGVVGELLVRVVTELRRHPTPAAATLPRRRLPSAVSTSATVSFVSLRRL